jgi:hypothetical protein
MNVYICTVHRKVHIYIGYQRVCPLVGIGTPPPPPGECAPPGPNADDWRKSLEHCLLCAVHQLK